MIKQSSALSHDLPDIYQQGCEPEDKCCCIIPIKCGLQFNAIFTILYVLIIFFTILIGDIVDFVSDGTDDKRIDTGI